MKPACSGNFDMNHQADEAHTSRKRKLATHQDGRVPEHGGFTRQLLISPNAATAAAPTSFTTSTCIGSDEMENKCQLKHDVQSVSASVASRNNNSGAHDHFPEDSNVLVMKATDHGADNYKLRQSLEHLISSPRNDDKSANFVVKDGSRIEKSDIQRSKSSVGKFTSVYTEKLWDGLLQLNSSVTVSAVASFKSGEKMPDLKWPEFIGVKGKVRLEAFEKYIQDLPRSRSRGLMVISLHCKGRSSKSELAGMKEVAKGYNKGERVGLAQLSKGIDLYVCPHSDTIITTLAKHGFFKGMAAAEDDRNSMIGCVVWKRNQLSSSSMVKKSERQNHCLAEQPLKSTCSSSQMADKKDLPRAQPAQKFIQVESRVGYKNVSNEGNNNVQRKHIETGQAQPELQNSSTVAPSLTSSVLSNSSAMLKRLGIPSTSDTADISTIIGQRLQVEVPPISSPQKKLKPVLEVQRPVLNFSSDTINNLLQALDNDDLPEFDFGSASCVSQTPASKLSDTIIVEKKLPGENLVKANRLLLPMVSSINSISAINQIRPPLQNTVYGYERIPVLTNSEEKLAPLLKKRFDDDDDMPEWRPPTAELHRQVVSETPGISKASMFYQAPHSTFQGYPRGFLNYPFRSSSPGTYPPLAALKLTHTFKCPMNQNVKPALASILPNPNSLIRFNSRPPFNGFDIKIRAHSDGLNNWRPSFSECRK